MIIEEDETIYVMEKWVYNIDFPYPTDLGDEVIKPYHDGWYMIATELGSGSLKMDKEFFDLGELINALKPYSGINKIINEVHPYFKGGYELEGYVDSFKELSWESYQEVKSSGIEIEGFD